MLCVGLLGRAHVPVLCDCSGLLEIHTALKDEEDTTEEDKKTRQKTHTDDEGSEYGHIC